MPESFAVTTGLTSASDTIKRAIEIAGQLDAPYIRRRGRGIASILADTGADYVLIVQADRLALSDGATLYYYHPNMLLVRGLNVLRGMRDLYVDAAQFKPGESVLDCTLGFACEASLAALAVGPEGHVTGLESEPALATLTRIGLAEFSLATPPLREAMRRVNVITSDYASFIQTAHGKSFDVVSFDPFFDERIDGSEHSVNPLARFGNNRPLDAAAVLRAREVARRRVILKHPRNATLPPELAALFPRVIASRKGPTAYSLFEPV